MNAASELELSRLRAWINERVTDDSDPDGSATTRFSDAELQDIWVSSDSPYEAAGHAWMQKAGRYESEISDVEERGTGSEKLKLRSLDSMLDYAHKMAEFYFGKGRGTSLAMDITSDECLTTEVDFKRLLGDPAGW